MDKSASEKSIEAASKSKSSDQIGQNSPDDDKKNRTPNKVSGSPDLWALEDVFPQLSDVLAPSARISAADKSVLVVLDTNALLLPFNVNPEELSQFEKVYKQLAAETRLYVPARVMREFIKNRDGRLATIAKTLNDKRSEVAIGGVDIPPLLEGLQETEAMVSAAKELKRARKQYMDSMSKLVELIRAWRGDDPVTSTYRGIFEGGVIADVNQSREDVEAQWAVRLRRKVPPGYKDGAKGDTGIGDFLVWLTILQLGRQHERSLIFVTGEEKADWFVRSDREGIYPRPELVDEYRRESKGKHLRLAKLADVLAEMDVSKELVLEVRNAENVANSAIQMESSYGKSHVTPLQAGTVVFDYSKNNGEVHIVAIDTRFRLRFTKASDTSIYLMRCEGTPLIARARSLFSDFPVDFNEFDSSSSHYTITLGEVFLARNDEGYTLAGRITHIADDRRGAMHDEVGFTYSIFGPSQKVVAPALS
ncbi:PIN-like domain-containing protein [Bradyrhizobium symbiodeficiens]|uniref:PIN-like domain-containing protein n=1 Tax=Bradyrhizobium symbiodeficiens TaxID=1404367 RepID=UPI00140FBA55|nr:PIN-like domain-containing protein [Bradyrhizobium symbiodeficiens]QIO98360.1 DUF4935 domain-containing protein [Bradyrhizobium symbiodeficiens]